MSRYSMLHKTEEADLERNSKRWIEWALLISLIFTASLFFAFQKFDSDVVVNKKIDTPIKPEIIPPTSQYKKPPAPPKPQIPIESDDEEIPEDLTIEETDIDFTQEIDAPLPPPEEEDPIVPFYALSEKPVVIKKAAAKYPELARKASIEGMVTVKVLVDTKGDVEDVVVLTSHPLLDNAAIEAAWQFKFTPGKQRDRLVKVWVSVPFNFKLK
ncbi:MAG: energy transducer TonB [Calditrichota bacterium]